MSKPIPFDVIVDFHMRVPCFSTGELCSTYPCACIEAFEKAILSEREACAKVAEDCDYPDYLIKDRGGDDSERVASVMTAEKIAAAIRSRSGGIKAQRDP